MDIQPQTAQPISDDQELAKVLAGVSNDSDTNFSFEETPVGAPAPAPVVEEVQEPVQIEQPVVEMPAPSYSVGFQSATAAPRNSLEEIKKDALLELRPLVDKLNLSPEEKFDIYLLLLRSTDDTTLIPPAYATAQKIEDESKRAQALLDVIKEIDFLSAPAPVTL